jgi:hypothetical protein
MTDAAAKPQLPSRQVAPSAVRPANDRIVKPYPSLFSWDER